ncbi:solute carrier family 49 member A3 isoform X2 [Protopterus annectens]|uniref:solute carrier family 49 member A3 isoform X2 n=1 Tax=Protopterus annectens TaxID=7888 RepID=UPI001CFBC777|nr:solute carrier family 49 member A3 isoform X2 [Protopterus annectens]
MMSEEEEPMLPCLYDNCQTALNATAGPVAVDDANDSILMSRESLRKLLDYRTYTRRWFVLLVVCLLNTSNALLWLSFAPVADQISQYFHISLDKINWLSLVYLIVGVPFGLCTTWMLDFCGLRTCLILSAWLNMLGSIIRFFSVLLVDRSEVITFILLMIGQTLCALAQPLVLFAPTKVAALWFPENQRTTANMLASVANPFGIMLANLLSPIIVTDKSYIPLMLGIYSIPATLACILATAGIREKAPPTPPSASALSSTSEPFWTGMKMLFQNRAYVLLMCCFGVGCGIFTAFSTLLEQILCVRGHSNFFIGLCGALFIALGMVGAALFGVYVDKTKRFMEVVKINFCLTALASIGFALVSRMTRSTTAEGLVVVVCALFGLFGISIYPVCMELAVECSYPVGEATSAGLLFVSGQVQGIVFIVLLQVLAKPLSEVDFSKCLTSLDAPKDWMMKQAHIPSAAAPVVRVIISHCLKNLHS